MKKTCAPAILFLLFLSLSACSDTKQDTAPGAGSSTGSTGTGADRPAGNAAPTISDGKIIPEHATPDVTLVAQYEARDREGDFVQYTFRWFVDNELAQEGPAGTLAPGTYVKGSEVYVEIIPADQYSAGEPFRTSTVTIGNKTPSVSAIRLTPQDPRVGVEITAAVEGTDPDGDDIAYRYQWFVNGKAVTEAPQESEKLSTQRYKKRDMVHVMVTPSDRDSAGRPEASDVLVLGNSAPKVTSTPKYELQEGLYSYQVTAKDPDNDRLTFSLATSPSGMKINASTGLVRWEVPKQSAEREEVFIKIVVDDGDGGSATQEFSLILNP